MNRSDAPANAWDPDDYDENHVFVHEYGDEVLDLLRDDPGDRVLDLGCGTGHLTARLAERAGRDGSVVGVDRSPEMIARAREAYPNVEFVRGDARSLDEVVDGPFDAVFSNAALHWITDPDAVLASVGAVLRSGGEFVAEFGGTGNVGTIVAAVEAELAERGYEGTNPWYFPTIGEYATRLETNGFEVRYATLFDRPTQLDGEDGLRNWLGMFGDSLLMGVPEADRDAVFAGIESRLEGPLRRQRTWYADYRRLRVRAVLE